MKPWSVVMISAVSRHMSLAIHEVEQAAQILVAHRDQGGVVGAQFRDLVGPVDHLPVARPVEDRPAVVGRVVLAEALGREERLVRVEGLEMQEPVVGAAIDVEELEAAREALHRREVLLRADPFAIDHVLEAEALRVGLVLDRVVLLA